MSSDNLTCFDSDLKNKGFFDDELLIAIFISYNLIIDFVILT